VANCSYAHLSLVLFWSSRRINRTRSEKNYAFYVTKPWQLKQKYEHYNLEWLEPDWNLFIYLFIYYHTTIKNQNLQKNIEILTLTESRVFIKI